MKALPILAVVLACVMLVAGCVPAATPPPPTPTAVPPTPTPGPVDKVTAFQNAFNKGAIDETAAMFTDNNVGITADLLGLVAAQGVRDNLEAAAGLGLNLEFSDCKPDGEAVNCQLLMRSDGCLKGFGLDPAHGTARIKFKDGKIILLTTEMAKDEGKTWFDAQFNMNAWARLNQPDVAEKLSGAPDANVTARQQGELYTQLCKDWAAVKK